MLTSDTIGAIAAALAKAQGQIQAAAMDAKNPAFKRDGKESKYATLASVWEACRSALTANEIAVVQAPGTDESGSVVMTTTLCHSSGEWMRTDMACRPASATAQAMGSVITYLRRYSLAAMTGVAPDDDDDGNAASGITASGTRPQNTVKGGGNRGHAETPFDAPAPAPVQQAVSAFWSRQSYELASEKAPFNPESFCKACTSAPNEDALMKLKEDNLPHLSAVDKLAHDRCLMAFRERMSIFAQAPMGQAAE